MLESKFYAQWYEQVVLPPENDYIACVSASSKTPVSGTGKTTAGAGIAKALDRSPGGFEAESQASLNADEFANTVIPDAPDKAAVLMDESQGTPGGGSGFNRMRAMSQSTLDAVGSLLANRDKNLTVIIVVQQFGMLFSDFYPLVDSWFLIDKAPGQVGGPSMKHHKVHIDDYPDGGGGMRTPVVETVDWPPISEDDPEYAVMEEKKQAAKQKGQEDDEDDEMTESEQLRWARAARRNIPNKRETGPVAWSNVPDAVEKEYGVELPNSGEYYRKKLSDAEDEDEVWSSDSQQSEDTSTEEAAAA